MLRGAVNERTGTDGKPYAIGFEMRLPDAWNGGYFDQLNGGNDGSVVPAYGNLPTNQPDNALARGYAVLSSDSGHDGRANADALDRLRARRSSRDPRWRACSIRAFRTPPTVSSNSEPRRKCEN